MITPSFALLFDENISYRVVKRILHLFPGSQPAKRSNLVAKEDPLLWQTAKASGFSIITCDDDYENLSQLHGWPPKVILLRPGNLSNEEVVSVMERNIDAISDFLFDQDFDARGVLKTVLCKPKLSLNTVLFMKTMKGPGIFLAQFLGDTTPFNSLETIARYMADLGYKGIQIPTWDSRMIDLKQASESQTYCDELKGKLADIGVEITELATHLQGQLVAVHPAYGPMFDGFGPAELAGKPKEQQAWAVDQLMMTAKASKNLGLQASPTFSGALLWPFVYPWPQRPAGLVETGFTELANRWLPILNAYDEAGVDLAYELHPGEDLHDGITFEMFLEKVGNHPRAGINYDPSHFVLQQLDYLQFIDFYHDRIYAYHVKDAEFNPTGKQGVYGGYQGWVERAGRFRSLGDGQVDFSGIFSKLAQYDYDRWAVLEWECALKHPEQGAAEGAPFIDSHIIRVTERAFDDFAGTGADENFNKKVLGL